MKSQTVLRCCVVALWLLFATQVWFLGATWGDASFSWRFWLIVACCYNGYLAIRDTWRYVQ